MQITLDYGKTGLTVELPDRNVVGPLDLCPSPPIADPAAALERVLDEPTGTPSLGELASGRNSACILICDITRPVPNHVLLSRILPILENAGIRRDRICILIATGLHRPNEGEELIELVGEKIAERYRIENHHGKELAEHVALGQSPRGIPVWIDRRYIEADLKIATGLIEPHLMAGYSGGRKLICPGIAALETVKAWHSPAFLEHPRADCGILDGNPVHEENTRIARMAGCDFIVNVTIDHQRQITAIVAGDMERAFLEGVAFLEPVVQVKVAEPCDIVVTSSAGHPLDTTFYQSVKGLTGALPIVKLGGTIILAASLVEGIGSPEFCQLLQEFSDLESFMDRVRDKAYFVMDQWQLEKLAQVRRQANVIYVSDGLPAETLKNFFVDVAPTVEAAVAGTLEIYGPDARIAVIPKGPYVMPVLANQ